MEGSGLGFFKVLSRNSPEEPRISEVNPPKSRDVNPRPTERKAEVLTTHFGR
jgi:hypothetical protein